MNDQLSPAFVLARAGYDVWLGNSRGSKYSRNHASLDPDADKEFWQYSWQEMAEHDLPAMIDYVRLVTGAQKLSYVGHSQGTTQMFLALGIDNAGFWKERINLFVATAPVIMPNRESKLFGVAAKLEKIGERALAKLAVYELFGRDWYKVQAAIRVLVPQLTDAVLG